MTAALLLNAASIGFQPLHPTSLALMPLPATSTDRQTDEADEGVVTAVAVTVEAAGDGMCSMGEKGIEGVIGGDRLRRGVHLSVNRFITYATVNSGQEVRICLKRVG